MESLQQHLGSQFSRLRNRYFLFVDALSLPAVGVIALVVRFEGWTWPAGVRSAALWFLALAIPYKLAVLWVSGLYRRLWRYASVSDLERILVGTAAAGVGSIALGAVVLPGVGIVNQRIPLSVLVIDAMLTLAVIALPRLFARSTVNWKHARGRSAGRRVLIAGAGAAGGMIVKELLNNPQLRLDPVAVLDDDSAKHGHRLLGVPVVGALAELGAAVQAHGVDEVIIAMPSAPGRVVRDVVRAAQEAAVLTRTVPGVFEIISGRKAVSELRRVEIADLLRREPVSTDLDSVRMLAAGDAVLVTGAGGSIGSELCRQLAQLQPSRIIALGRGENSIFELLGELTREFPCVHIDPVIADVRDYARLERVFRQYRPHAVFHAAAHKHVPLMEQNVSEAVINNVAGTRNVAQLAAKYGCEHFVLISTDKAVRPTSIMGATKRIAESVVHEVAVETGKHFVSVRFGNVLGSRGSVVPTFLRQIAAGGPITVTHPEMRRYFMTIPEAVQLVLQAGAMGRGQETFVLDMGEPVKIADLAADLIRLSGLEVGTDIEIKFTGARPGEKLYEELFFSSEHALPTGHPKVLRGRNAEFPRGARNAVDELVNAALRNESQEILRRHIGRLVPEYQPPVDSNVPFASAEAGPRAVKVV